MNETAATKISYKKILRRLLSIAVGVFALFFVAVASLSYFVLDSKPGTQWSLRVTQRFLPNLSVVDAQGTWQGGLTAQQIAWRGGGTHIELDNVELRLSWSALLRGEIHLFKLHARALRIVQKGPSGDAPIVLPTLFLPLPVAITDFALQQLDIVNSESTFSLHNLRGDLRWRATTLQLAATHIEWQDMQLDAAGKIGFRGDYPLQLQGRLALPQWREPIAIQTQGTLRKLELKAQSKAPYALNAAAQLATLEKNLPLHARIELARPFAQSIGADRVEIEKGTIDAHGDLTRIEGAVALRLNDSRYGASKLDGTVRWRPETLQAQLRWQPSDGVLQLQCDAALSKPVSARCTGNATALSLSPWLAGQTATISGAIKLEAKWLDPQWSLALGLPDLSGKFNNDAIAAVIAVRTDDGAQWQLQPSLLRIGPNELKGSGQFGDRNRVQLTLNAPDLARLHARAAGSLTGHIAIEGNSGTPTVRARLNGNRLQFENMRAAQAHVNILLPQLGNDSGRGRIEVRKLTIAEFDPFDLTLSIGGVRTQQRWVLLAQQTTDKTSAPNNNQVALHCTTHSDENFDEWQFDCPQLSGRIRKPINQSWRNTAPLSGRAQISTKRFELAPLCLRGEDAELCLDRSLQITGAKIQPFAVHARGIPLRWSKPWLPDDFNLINDPRISAQAQFHSVAPLDAKASVEIPQTQWRWHTATTTETAAIDAIRLDATLDEKRAFIATSAQSPTLGRIDAHLAIIDPRQRRQLDGRVEIVQMQLAGLAWALQGLDAIGGEINGSIGITGTASAPQLRGKLLLKDGNALWAPLGAPFRTVHADLTFDNNSAKLGGWFALGQGGGDIDGAISWNGDGAPTDSGATWKARLGVVAGGVSAMPLPGSTVVFSPHAELTAMPGEVHIDGYIDIASAEIHLKQLPPETIDVSQDQEIVGQQLDEDALKIWTKLGVNLGEQFHLEGFGADVNLSGRLQLSKEPGDNLHLSGEVKVPRGRYRAYGQRLTVRKGSVIFYGPTDNPDLNLEAVRDMPPGVTDVVGMRVIGSLKTPEAILFSEPSMPDSDIAYYLLTGRKPVAGATGATGYSASGALLSLGLAGSESRAGQLAEKFGITDLQLGTSETKNGESEAEVSGQLGKDLYVRYGRGLGQQSNSISFQYRLTPKLMIETISGVEDALDLLYSFEVK